MIQCQISIIYYPILKTFLKIAHAHNNHKYESFFILFFHTKFTQFQLLTIFIFQKTNSESQEYSKSNDNYTVQISSPSQIAYKYLSGDEESNSGDNENEIQTNNETVAKVNNEKFVWEDSFSTIYSNSELPNPTTEYDEVKILEHIENAYEKSIIKNNDTKMARLRAKLKLRKLKRKKHLPLFNLDS